MPKHILARHWQGWIAGVVVSAAVLLSFVAAFAQGPEPRAPNVALGTDFTYQGQLKKNGVPVNGACSLTFSLWDASSNGAQLGSSQTLNPVNLANGVFTVVLNGANQFGASAFTGQARYLQTAAQCAGDGSPIALSRQPVTAAPYALFAAAPWQTSGSNLYYNGGNVGIGTSTPAHHLGINGGPLWTSNNWSGALELSNASAIGWRENGLHLRYGIGHTNGGLAFFHTASDPGTTGSAAFYDMFITDAGQVGIGTLSPVAQLEVVAAVNLSAVSGTASNGDGVHGDSGSGWGVSGNSSSGIGVHANSGTGYGLYANSFAGYAAWLDGKVHISGPLEKPGGSFKIDHPIDPANQYLYHSFVESPDMKNIYDGVVTTDANGDATVTLPDWFEALNQNFRYQLTIMGKQWAQARIEEEIHASHFSIKTDQPNIKVSWQVTGIRHDPWAEQHRIPVEEQKPAAERGHYLYPTEYGQPETLGIDYAKRFGVDRPITAVP